MCIPVAAHNRSIHPLTFIAGGIEAMRAAFQEVDGMLPGEKREELAEPCLEKPIDSHTLRALIAERVAASRAGQ